MGRRGGTAGRRVVARWSWRMFRREWRQQSLVLLLLTLAVAAGIAGASAVYNTAGVSETAAFGQARAILAWDDVDPAGLADHVAAAEAQGGPGDVEIVTEWARQAPGAVDDVTYRAQGPDGPLTAGTLALLSGRYPSGTDETAITDGVAQLLQIDVGDVLDLDGVERTVVGRVENPADLGSEFALVAPDAASARPETALLLLRTEEQVDALLATERFGGEQGVDIRTRGEDMGPLAAATVVGALAVVLLLVALLSTAGFVVLAQRRQQQFGLLAAVGAPARLLAFATLIHGFLVGLAAATVGSAIGLGGWLVVTPRVEQAVGHRIAALHLPWGLLVSAAGMAVVAATLAAWLPARLVARMPVTTALSGRPPAPRLAHRSGVVALAVLVGGVSCLVASTPRSTGLAVAGTVATVVGVLLLGPWALRGLAAVARWLPVGLRLAFRNLGRYQVRSGAALAAVTLAVGIPAGIVVTSSAAEHNTSLGNLPADQLLVWTRNADDPAGFSPFYSEDRSDSGFAPFTPDLTAADLAEREEQVDRMAAELGDAAVVPLDVAVDPALADLPEGQLAVTLGREVEGGQKVDVALLYLAEPELIGRYGPVPRDELAIYTTEKGELSLTNLEEHEVSLEAPIRLEPSYTSLPGSFISRAELDRLGLDTQRIGWLIDADHALTGDDLAQARGRAAGGDLLVEAQETNASLRDLRTWAAGVAAALALGIVAATVGLLRSDAARETRMLAAVGASSGLQRMLTAATAGGLALLGVVLGTAAAYLTLITGYHQQLGDLSPAPLRHLLLLVVGIPALAAAGGWLAGGRSPTVVGVPS